MRLARHVCLGLMAAVLLLACEPGASAEADSRGGSIGDGGATVGEVDAAAAPDRGRAGVVDAGGSAGGPPTPCPVTCREPLSCICGECAVSCTGPEACAAYSGRASCELPPAEGACDSSVRACHVPCTHDGVCAHLGDDFVCLVGRCRHDSTYLSTARVPACEPQPPVAGLCVYDPEGTSLLSNDGPLVEGTIIAVGDAVADPDCFGGDHPVGAIRVGVREGEAPVVPTGTSWWRVDDGSSHWTVGIAAPGLAELGVGVGDTVSFRNDVSQAGADWADGNAEVNITGRGKVSMAINDASRIAVSQGPAACELAGPCGGSLWSMHIDVDGTRLTIPPFESVAHGQGIFTNAGALTHWREYREPDEETERTPGCAGEPRTNFVATRVDTL